MSINPYSQSNYGALSTVEQDDGSFTYPIYGVQSNTYTGGQSLQDVYGTAAMPMFQWVQRIQTGQGSFNPDDPADNDMLEKYEDFLKNNPQAQNEMPSTAEIVGEIATPFAMSVGSQIGLDIANTGGQNIGASAVTGVKDVFSTTSADIAPGRTFFSKGSANNLGDAQFQKLTDAVPRPDGTISTNSAKEIFGSEENIRKAGGVVGADFSAKSNAGDLLWGDAAKQNWASAAGAGLGVFAIGLATGKDPVKAAKSAGGTILGKAFGTALFGPIGGFFGGTIGSIIGGRVICNELMRQGIMTRKQVILDYKFTRDYLTPTHVNGYHVWAVWMVKQMRKGKFVKFWKHVAGHRANEIAYIYGERDNPDYLGKVYRRLLEPLCWSIGLFCNQSDWSVLYNKKEI